MISMTIFKMILYLILRSLSICETLPSAVLSRIFFVDTAMTAKKFGEADAHLKLR